MVVMEDPLEVQTARLVAQEARPEEQQVREEPQAQALVDLRETGLWWSAL